MTTDNCNWQVSSYRILRQDCQNIYQEIQSSNEKYWLIKDVYFKDCCHIIFHGFPTIIKKLASKGIRCKSGIVDYIF